MNGMRWDGMGIYKKKMKMKITDYRLKLKIHLSNLVDFDRTNSFILI